MHNEMIYSQSVDIALWGSYATYSFFLLTHANIMTATIPMAISMTTGTMTTTDRAPGDSLWPSDWRDEEPDGQEARCFTGDLWHPLQNGPTQLLAKSTKIF